MKEYEIIKTINAIKNKGGLSSEEIENYFNDYELHRANNVPLDEISSRTILIMAFDDLIWYVINKKFFGTKDNSLYGEGLIGLIKAVDNFSLEKHSKFMTYASICIKNEILMYLRTKEKIMSKEVLSFDSSVADFDDLTLGETIRDDEDIVQEYADQDEFVRLSKGIRLYLKNLTKIEQGSLLLRYGLYGFPVLNQEDIAQICSCSQSYVCRAIKSATRKIYQFVTPDSELTDNELMEKYANLKRNYPLFEFDDIYKIYHEKIVNK